MTRHCWKCGHPWTLTGLPGRSETCPQCRSDLRVCLNCASYDPRAAHQCRDRRAEPEFDKQAGNFCEWFDFARRDYQPPAQDGRRESQARDDLRRLLGDEPPLPAQSQVLPACHPPPPFLHSTPDREATDD